MKSLELLLTMRCNEKANPTGPLSSTIAPVTSLGSTQMTEGFSGQIGQIMHEKHAAKFDAGSWTYPSARQAHSLVVRCVNSSRYVLGPLGCELGAPTCRWTLCLVAQTYSVTVLSRATSLRPSENQWLVSCCGKLHGHCGAASLD